MSIGLDNNYALLVGIGDCVDDGWSLPATVNDVEALKSLLTDSTRCGYIDDEQHLLLLKNETATKEGILAGLKWLEEKAKSDSEATVVIYYSGHGYLDKHTQKYYLVPHDNNNLLPAEYFNQALQKIQAKRLLVVIDSCHAGGMTAKDEILPMAFPAKELVADLKEELNADLKLNKLKQGKGRAVFSSSTGEQKSWVQGDRSIFTSHFLEALQGAGSHLGENEVFVSNLITYLKTNVELSTRKFDKKQTPFFEFVGEDFPVALLPENWSPPQSTINEDLYIEQPVVKSCYDDILQPGCLLRIKAPWKMGKTTLMSRILKHAANSHKYRTAVVNVRDATKADFSNLDEFLKWFCANVAISLKIENSSINPNEYWNRSMGNGKNKCKTYFEKYLLPGNSPLALAIDEIDRIIPYQEIAGEFLAMLRARHENAKTDTDNEWAKLRLVVVYAEEYREIDPNQSPFNAGIPVELTELNSEQVQDLAQQYQLNWDTHQVEQIMDMLGGHPYLIHEVIKKLKQQNISINELLENAPTNKGIYREHLLRLQSKLEQSQLLYAAFKEILTAEVPVELNLELARQLDNLGLVKLDDSNRCAIVRYKLYRQYFISL
ncbi:MAG: AAA-like domain-containing protein [Nostoc sp. DedQUE01]|nr:AAA-like domain-containing protein [Nostoc sp. DedQUE01]